MNEIETLRARNDELLTQLAERPDTDAAVRLAELEREQETWHADRVDLSRQVSELKRRLAYFDTDANEREDQRNVIASLESQRQLLHAAHEQVRAEIDDLLSRNEATSPFPACTAMDADSALQSVEPVFDDVGDLEAFAEDLQHRIASDPERRDTLYYSLADLRSFIGGLAMSPLVLLQGISGTGKTSLPMAFARAVGTKADVIEVQAGWRDPQDLAGHYNAFEKKFYEKEFLQALYRAGTPRWEDTIRIVLLDEMNLSHPEQYFSDLLSALELPPEDRRLVLMTHPVESAPSRLIEGRELRIPPNVWFVGTANHDETTMDFADKTYDRSHVMEFPHRPKPFEVDKPPPRSPVSFGCSAKGFPDRDSETKPVREQGNRIPRLRDTRSAQERFRRRLGSPPGAADTQLHPGRSRRRRDDRGSDGPRAGDASSPQAQEPSRQPARAYRDSEATNRGVLAGSRQEVAAQPLARSAELRAPTPGSRPGERRMSFRDRISGRLFEVEQLPERTLFGRWLFDPKDAAAPMRINGCPADAGDALTPGAASDWALIRPGDTVPTRGRFFADPLPDEQDVEALLQLGGLLRDPEKAKGGWLDWSETSPLAPGLDEAIKPHPLRRTTSRPSSITSLPSAETPRTHIRVETERVLVARARRIAPNAPAWLASHTEDWDYRKISGVQPRRILAEVREERWDLYENRVAVRLVDSLVTWLRRRIAEVRRILDDIFARMESFGESVSGTRHRAERIYRMWGEAWDASHGREIAERTLKRLDRLLYRVLGLMDSRLYRRIPRRAPAPRVLRMTNLLRNDDHYRGVTRLWHAWSRLPALRAPSPSELYVRHQKLCSGFDAWCMLLVVRACSQLNLDPAEDEEWESEIRPGCNIPLDRGFHIEWQEEGSVTLADGARTLVRFVPLVHALERARTPRAVRARIDPLVDGSTDAAHWTVILHPAVPGSPPHDSLAGIGDPPEWVRAHDNGPGRGGERPIGNPSDRVVGVRGAVDFMRVSPFSLDSVERVSRALRWATLAPRMLAYPWGVRAVEEWVIPDMVETGTWLVGRGSSSWAVVRPPHQNELSKLNIANRLRDARSRRDSLKEQHHKVQDDLRSTRGDRRRMSELNREKNRLLPRVREVEDAVGRLSDFEQELRSACRNVTALATCPVCGGAEVDFDPRENDCFAARCGSKGCNALWELRHDAETGSRIPVLLPSDAKPATWPTDADPRQWVDDILGCDILAVPRYRSGDDIGFRPPRNARHEDSWRTLPSRQE